ncbi:MAG: phage holin family protein [Peptostreptococcaceae bacterium]
MEKIIEWIQSIISWFQEGINFTTIFLGGVLCYLLGGFDIMIELLLTAMALDFLTGFLKGIKTKKLSSNKARDGMIKKIGTIIVIASAVILDKLFASQGKDTYFRNLVTGVFIIVELISLVENVETLGVKIPKRLRSVLAQLKNKEFEGDEKKE